MRSTDEFQEAFAGRPKSVDVSAIERELTELWQAAAHDGDGQAVVRACILNLVVYVPGQALLDRVTGVVSELTVHHPSRAIVLVAEPDAAEVSLDAWITAHCQMPPAGGAQVCCEQISVVAQGSSVHDLHGTAIPLLVADLPVFLWWLSDPSLDDHLFRVLDDTADRLIVDSARFRRPVETLARLAERISRLPRPGEAALSDLNWARLTPWRELIAQFFDAPHLQSYLPALTEVSIEYCPGARDRPNPCQALLLAGWLVSRLGWHYTDSQPLQPQRGRPGYRLSLEGPQPVGILLRPGPPDPASTGDVTSVRLVAGAGLPPARFTVNRADDGVCAVTTVHVEGMKPVSRVAGMEPPTEAQLLSQNLDVLGRDPIYEAALATAARFEIPT